MIKRFPFVFCFLLIFAPAVFAQRESWAAPRAANWKQPPLVEWQRNYDDALALSFATGRPLLICVNMDGEAASENYAGIRYRTAEFAKLANVYIPLIVSVDRHNARDYDDSGKRIPCPRFGRVTCGEHIELEPRVFDKYFKNQRVAPRHIGVSDDGKILFDCFLNFDASPVVKALRDNAASAAPKAEPSSAAGVDVKDREAAERDYIQGDINKRKSLLESALNSKSGDATDLIRLGVYDSNETVAALARKALVARATPHSVSLLVEALRRAKSGEERDALVTVLTRLSKDSARARWVTTVFKALSSKSNIINTNAWFEQLKKPAPAAAAPDADELDTQIQKCAAQLKESKDPALATKLASLTLQFAENRMAAGKDPGYLLADAGAALDQARKLGADSEQYHLLRALVANYQNHPESIEAELRKALPGLLADAFSKNTFNGLAMFARTMYTRIAADQNANKEWPAQWLSDAHVAYSVAEAHPLAVADTFAQHVDLLFWLDAVEVGYSILEKGLHKFPDAAALHERLRARILEDRGLDALETTYSEMVKKTPGSGAAHWFSGFASITAAEYYKKGGRDAESNGAYGRAIALFEKSAQLVPDYHESSEHYISLALAGRARVELEVGNLDAAVADLAAAFARKPQIGEVEDGLSHTPAMTLRSMRWTLDEEKRADLREKLESELTKIDPDLASRPSEK
ncbi:MAG: hypothetical protein HY286_11860 [Planctomycetes bacterium]|nr:hypothetical protein [Planctomycetota bacterium]